MCAVHSRAQVLLVQVTMFRELVNVRYSQRRFKDVPLFRTSQWGWFWTCLTYSYGNSFLAPHRRSLLTSKLLMTALPYVELVTLLMYSGMLVLTVLTLKHGYYKYQASLCGTALSTSGSAARSAQRRGLRRAVCGTRARTWPWEAARHARTAGTMMRHETWSGCDRLELIARSCARVSGGAPLIPSSACGLVVRCP